MKESGQEPTIETVVYLAFQLADSHLYEHASSFRFKLQTS